MRSFAAATVVAVAAAALLAMSLAVYIAGSVEALGSLSGRTVIDMTDLPVGPTKAEQVEDLARIAADHDVSLGLVVPDRSGDPATLDEYVLHGAFAPPAFWTTIEQHPSDRIGDAVIVWSYAVDGPAADVANFLTSLRSAGYEFIDGTPLPWVVLPALLGEADVMAVAVALALGVVIALVAESHRRAPRQRLRRLSGWSSSRIAARELLAISGLLGSVFAVVFCLFVAILLVRGASPAVMAFCLTSVAILGALCWIGVTALHVLFAVVGRPLLAGNGLARWRPVMVGAMTVGLVVTLVVDADGLGPQADADAELERSLEAESAHGDDITLGVGFTDYDGDQRLGVIGTRAIERGTARMAWTNALSDTLVLIGDETPGLPRGIASRDGITVLVPDALAHRTAEILDEVKDDVTAGWEIEQAVPPREVPYRTELVGTSDIVLSAERWVEWGLPKTALWPDIAVVVVSDPRDLAPNRVGTATANGEVRFSDRAVLEQELRAEGLYDSVTQFNRVGAIVERQLAEVRSDRIVALVATVVAALAALFACWTLVADRRIRSQHAWRVRSLAGCSAVVHHVGFVATAAAGTALIVAGTLGVLGVVSAVTVLASAVAGALIVGAALSSFLVLTHHTERIRR